MTPIVNTQMIKTFEESQEFKNLIERVNGLLKSTNIFEISGMGSQEIKHSKILGWLMSGDHELGASFFRNFLLGSINFTKQKHNECSPEILKKLEKYISKLLDDNPLIVKFEYKNIDILIIDEKNKFVFIIENKVFAQESVKQLKTYREIVSQDFKDYTPLGIFLTIDGSLPDASNEEGDKNLDFYLVSRYQDIYTILLNLLNNHPEPSVETRIIIRLLLKPITY